MVPNIGEIVASTIESRSRTAADNVTKNNAFYRWLKKAGNVKTVSGGSQIFQEFTFQENGNFGWYSGYDLLPVNAQEVLSGATFTLKQAACAVLISGLEQLQNNGKEEMIDLLETRISNAEGTMINNLSAAVYSDGTGSGGKQLTGLASAVSDTPLTGTYGGIDRSLWPFWRNQVLSTGGAFASATVLGFMNTMWASLVRGQDRTKLILTDTLGWNAYVGALQNVLRFTSTDDADAGFAAVKFMDADVVLDGGIGGFAPANRMYFLNPKYLFYRPHKDRNMVPLSPNKRIPINQDAEVQILAFAGQITSNGAQFQGILRGA